ncbi:MAG: hypothetical protein WDN75_10095 [Bacteroidota bacterium]
MNKFLLIQNALSGTADKLEMEKLEQWVAQSRDNLDESEHLKLLWRHMKNPVASVADVDMNEGFSNIRRMLRSGVRQKQQ